MSDTISDGVIGVIHYHPDGQVHDAHRCYTMDEARDRVIDWHGRTVIWIESRIPTDDQLWEKMS